MEFERQQNISPVVKAAEWAEVISSGMASSEDMKRFQSWLDESPDNEKDYVECCQIWALASVPEFWSKAPEEFFQGNADKVKREHLADSAGWKWRCFRAGWGSRMVLALASVVLVVGVAMVFFEDDPIRYQTITSEQRQIVLEDGTSIHLNTATVLEVYYSHSRRRIHLLQGEAFFDVKKDPGRVFEVEAGAGITRVLGTQFTVRNDGGQTATVTVAEGKVEIVQNDMSDASPQLVADQQLTYGAQGFVSPIKSVKASNINSWRSGMLRFSGDTLSRVVEEINRYSVKKLIVGDEALNRQPISGIYRIGETESFVYGISQTLSIKVIERGNQILLLSERE